MEAGISLGSNLGDRLVHLREAQEAIASLPGVRLLSESPVYETEPVGVPERYRGQPFLNAVLILDCGLGPYELMAHLHALESRLGRVRAAERNSPRVIDADILYMGALELREDSLQIPHRQWSVRRFVVQPLADVRPDLVLPGQTQTVREILLSLPKDPNVVVFTDNG